MLAILPKAPNTAAPHEGLPCASAAERANSLQAKHLLLNSEYYSSIITLPYIFHHCHNSDE